MGIVDLLPNISAVFHRCNLSDFRGKRIAIDGFVWLHKYATRYASELIADPSSTVLLPILEERIKGVIQNGLIPVIVFDGQNFPLKSRIDSQRGEARMQSISKAAKMRADGDEKGAEDCLKQAISITRPTVLTWIKDLERLGLEYIVAPYEADAQMAFLARSGYVDLVLTEDSDLIAYQSPTVLLKLDEHFNAVCVNFKEVLSFLELSPDDFLTLCILSGCDYCEHIKQMGFKTSLAMVKKYHSIAEILSAAKLNKKFIIPTDYANQFGRAFFAFGHQLIYDPRRKCISTVCGSDDPTPAWMGSTIPNEVLEDYVKGRIELPREESQQQQSDGEVRNPATYLNQKFFRED